MLLKQGIRLKGQYVLIVLCTAIEEDVESQPTLSANCAGDQNKYIYIYTVY